MKTKDHLFYDPVKIRVAYTQPMFKKKSGNKRRDSPHWNKGTTRKRGGGL